MASSSVRVVCIGGGASLVEQDEQRVLFLGVDADFELIDLRDYPMPFFDHPLPPATGEYAPAARTWAEKIGAGDAFIIVTPEYNWGYPAVLKNALAICIASGSTSRSPS